MKTQAALIALTCLAVSPVWAINKCTIDGQVVFQDAACPGKGESIKVRPASGSAPAATTEPTAAGEAPVKKPLTEAQRIEAKVKISQDARRKTALEERLVPGAEQDIERNRAQCDREYGALQAKKRAANNNLAGATWEASISSEMTALATRCDTRNRDLRADVEKLRAECQLLGGCK